MKSITELYRTLLRTYGKQNWWPAETPFEVCVGAILTQNTNWNNVEKAIENLKRENLLTPEKIISCPDEKLQKLIRPAGFFKQKSSYLKNLSKFIVEEGGIENLKTQETGTLRKRLLNIKGVGKETADSILLYALDKPSFVVDTYTKRLFYRLRIVNKENVSYEELKSSVENTFPPEKENLEIYKEFHALIVRHAKERCRKTPICRSCPLEKKCLACATIMKP